MVILGISIGIGDYVAGRVSGQTIRPGLIPFGAAGTTVTFFVLGLLPLNYYLVATWLALSGFLAGFFMVPLQTMIQHLTPEDQRGRVLGLWNCGSFVGIILGNIVFLGMKQTGMPSNRVFLFCGVLGLIGVFTYYFRWRSIFADALNAANIGGDRETAAI